MPDSGPLKLRAHDADDLAAVAACLQDALVPLSDVAYLKSEKRFVMVANRFKWETGPDGATPPPPEPAGDASFDEAASGEATGPVYERVNCGVCFDRVKKVRFRGLDPKRRDKILNLLTLHAERGAVTLVFSGGAAIRLEVSSIRCHLEDLTEPWPTRQRPSHDEAESAVEDHG